MRFGFRIHYKHFSEASVSVSLSHCEGFVWSYSAWQESSLKQPTLGKGNILMVLWSCSNLHSIYISHLSGFLILFSIFIPNASCRTSYILKVFVTFCDGQHMWRRYFFINLDWLSIIMHRRSEDLSFTTYYNIQTSRVSHCRTSTLCRTSARRTGLAAAQRLLQRPLQHSAAGWGHEDSSTICPFETRSLIQLQINLLGLNVNGNCCI